MFNVSLDENVIINDIQYLITSFCSAIMFLFSCIPNGGNHEQYLVFNNILLRTASTHCFNDQSISSGKRNWNFTPLCSQRYLVFDYISLETTSTHCFSNRSIDSRPKFKGDHKGHLVFDDNLLRTTDIYCFNNRLCRLMEMSVLLGKWYYTN